jgi:hypothetical protein
MPTSFFISINCLNQIICKQSHHIKYKPRTVCTVHLSEAVTLCGSGSALNPNLMCTVDAHSIRYITIRYITTRYNTIRYNTTRYITIRHITIHHITTPYSNNSLQQQLATVTIRYSNHSLQLQFATVTIRYSNNSLQ